MKLLKEFKTFDFEKFCQGKGFTLKKVEDKRAYDYEKGTVTDEVVGVKLELEIVLDLYQYEAFYTETGYEVGANRGETFTVVVEDGKKEDYEKMLGNSAFGGKQPVRISKVDSVKFYDPKGKPATLTVFGDIEQYTKEALSNDLEKQGYDASNI